MLQFGVTINIFEQQHNDIFEVTNYHKLPHAIAAYLFGFLYRSKQKTSFAGIIVLVAVGQQNAVLQLSGCHDTRMHDIDGRYKLTLICKRYSTQCLSVDS